MKTHRSVTSAILALGSVTLLGRTAAAQEQPAQVTVQQQSPPVVQTAPAAPHERETITEKGGPSTGMLASGVVIFGVSYGVAAVAGATSDTDGDNDLYVPFAGPWMALGNHEGAGSKVFLVTDGVFQGLGGLLVLNAFLNPQTRTVTRTSSAEVQVSPAVSPEFLGLAATGRF
jgi:hypothetical protein